MVNKVGFDLDNSYFYIHGSNIRDVVKISSTEQESVIQLFANSDSNACYNIGVNAAKPPAMWIGYGGLQDCSMSIQNSCVGIQTHLPEYTLDVHGDMHITGELIQSGSNSAINTNLMNVNNISGNSNIINFNDTNLVDIGSLHIKGLQRQVMNDTQHIQSLASTGIVDTGGTHTLAMTISWDPESAFYAFDETFEIDVSFFASGAGGTRMFVKAAMLVNAKTATLDMILDKTTTQSDNVADMGIRINERSIASIDVQIYWQLTDLSQHTGHLKIQVTAPVNIQNMDIN